MFICFLDRHGVIRKEFVPPGQDNTTSHTAFRVVEYLAQRNVATLPLPLLPRHGPVRLLSVPKNKINAQRKASWIDRGCSTGRDEVPKVPSYQEDFDTLRMDLNDATINRSNTG
ncbi:hypothetical protein TNCV_4016231 [Trichonephila clavipes]|nr:hypothetical protein TNCV_4016231 [Trichonephila clavipes]